MNRNIYVKIKLICTLIRIYSIFYIDVQTIFKETIKREREREYL